jgi:hypothetical protein
VVTSTPWYRDCCALRDDHKREEATMADELDPMNQNDDVRRRNDKSRSGEDEVINRGSDDEEFEDMDDDADEDDDEEELES